jgi:hypothetical protein
MAVHIETPSPIGVESQVCPYLGLASNKTRHLDDASEDHACYATVETTSPTVNMQHRTCLTSEHKLCTHLLRRQALKIAAEAEAERQSNSRMARLQSWLAATKKGRLASTE